MSEPLGPSQNHRQIDQQSDKRSVTGIKMSAHDILATLSGNRIEITKIEFTSRTSEGRGGHADVILATLVLDSFEPLKSGRQKVAIKKFRLSIEMDEEKFLRAFVNEIRVLDGLSHENVAKVIGFVLYSSHERLRSGRNPIRCPTTGNRGFTSSAGRK